MHSRFSRKNCPDIGDISRIDGIQAAQSTITTGQSNTRTTLMSSQENEKGGLENPKKCH